MAEKMVKTAFERIEEEFGDSFKKLGPEVLDALPTISTGSLLLNEALNESKGYPKGCIVEVFGPQHSGKTLLGLLAIAESQKKDPDRPCLIVDAERQFLYQAKWAQQLGVDVTKLYHTTVTSAEEAFSKMEMAILGKVEMKKEDKNVVIKKVIEPGNFGIILIDSVSQLVPLEEVHKSMDKSTRLAALAAAMSRGLRKVVSAQSLVDSKTTLFFINQTRSNPNAMFGNPEVRTGGNALPFYDTIAFRVSKVNKSEERDDKNKIVSHEVKVKFEKNKTGQIPADAITFRIKYDGTGVDNEGELFSVAEMNGLIKRMKNARKGNPALFNFIEPNSDEDGSKGKLLDESVEDFPLNEFGEVLEKNKNIKDMIMNFIRGGSFYVKDEDVEEDNPDVSEEQTLNQKKKNEDKKDGKDQKDNEWDLDAKNIGDKSVKKRRRKTKTE